MEAPQDTFMADPTVNMSKETSGSGSADWESNLNSDVFLGHFKRILSDHVPLFRFMFETQHTTNDSRLLEVYQRESVDGCLFPYLSSTRYVPVPPPAVLSCYLRISGRQYRETCDRISEAAASSKEFKRNNLPNQAGVPQSNGKDLDPAIIQCAIKANGDSGSRSCSSSKARRITYLCDVRTHHCLPHGLRIEKAAANEISSHSGRKSSLARRRPYTACELASAVRAICSGQLGTRRAASMYGIPRSTLRNKICKLNEIRKHEEAMRGGKPISLSEFFHDFAPSAKLPNDAFLRKDIGCCPSSVALPYRLASVFKVNCRTTPLERSKATSLCTFFGKNDVWSTEHPLPKMEANAKRMET